MMKGLEDIEAMRPIRRMLYVARWAVILGVLLATRINFTSAKVDYNNLTYALVAIAIATILYRILAGNRPSWHRPVMVVAADIFLVTVIVFFSDVIQSPFYPLYYITVISAAVTFGTIGALWSAVAIALVSLGIETVQAGGYISRTVMLEDVVRTVPYLFLIAVITGSLRSQIRTLVTAAVSLAADSAIRDREMEVASRVQKAQLPNELPNVSGIEICVCYKPAREVGGDLYDFYPVTGDSLGVIVADVAGKGVPAALMVSTAKYAVREHYSEDTVEMMRGVNQHVGSSATEDAFITMLYGTLSTRTREFRYINAGHMPPIVVKPSTCGMKCYTHADLPLGVADSADFTECVLQLECGDILVLYTDGVTDALAASGDGFAEFEQFIAGMCSFPLSAWGDQLLCTITEPLHLDDVTMVAIQIS